MLDQALERFDSDFFKIWRKSADRILKQLDLGLQKMSFPDGKSTEIMQLEALVIKAKTTEDKKEYAKTIDEIQALLDKLGKNMDFNNYHANNFIFHCRRSFNWLKTARLTENLQYAQAVLNPADKPEAKSELGFVQKQVLKRGIKKINRQVLANININVARFIEIQVASMPSLEISQVTPLPQGNTQLSLLEQRLGESKHNELKSQLAVSNAEEAAKYLSEQIHGDAFEFYYSQIAKLYGALDKAEKLAAEQYPISLGHREQFKKALLIESGLGDLGNSRGLEFLNNTAEHLGFKDAASLYHNYQRLHKSEEFSRLKEKKLYFMSFANRQDVFKENDPLEKIKNTMRKEYTRVLEKSKRTNLAYNNSAYTTIICYSAIDYTQSLEMLQKKKNIFKIIAQDIIDPRQQNENVGVFERIAMQVAMFAMESLSFKEKMDKFLRAAFHDEQVIYEKRLEESTNTIDKLWEDNAPQKMQMEKAKREKLFHTVDTLSEEALIAKYVLRVQAYKDASREGRKPARNAAAAVQMKIKFEKAKQDFITFKFAFDKKTNRKIASLSKEELGIYCEKKKSAISDLSTQIAQARLSLQNYTGENKKTCSRLNIIRRLRGRTSKKSKQSKIQKHAEYLKNNIERLQTQFDIEIHLLNRATQKQADLVNYETKDLSTIKENIKSIFFDKYLTLLQQSHADEEFIYEDIEALQRYYSHQRAFDEVENELLRAVMVFGEKLNSPAEKARLAQHGRLDTTNFLLALNQIKRELATQAQVNNPQLTSTLDSVIDSLEQIEKTSTKLKQSELLSLAKAKCDEYMKSENFIENDPFLQLPLQEPELIEALTSENKRNFFEYVKTQFIQTLEAKVSTLDRRALANEIAKMEYSLLLFQNKPSQVPEEQAFEGFYEACIAALNSSLEDKYGKIKQATPDIQRSEIAQLGAELSHFHKQLVEAKQNRLMLQQNYDSWLLNPFGLRISPEMLAAADCKITVQAKQLILFSQQYHELLQHYLNVTSQYYPTLPLNSLESHIIRLKQEIENLKELNRDALDPAYESKLSQIIKAHEVILKSAMENHDQHIEHQAALLNLSLAKLIQDSSQLQRLQENIHRSFGNDYRFEGTELENIESILKNNKAELIAIEAKFSNIQERYAQFAATGNTLPGFEALKRQIDAQLESLKQFSAQKIDLQHKTLSFYDKIQKGEQVVIDSTLDAERLGKGLIIAIEHNNTKVLPQLIRQASKMSMLDLAVALQKAAKKGNIETVKTILQSRSDLSFTQRDLSLAIKAALDQNYLSIVLLLLSQSGVEFDKDLSTLLTSHLPAQTTISPVDRGWGQMVVDNDGENLEAIRKCYRLQEQLILSLSANNENALPHQILQEIDDVKNKLLNALQNTHFENPVRKTEQIAKWENQIKQLKKIKLLEQETFEEEIESFSTTRDELKNNQELHETIVREEKVEEQEQEDVLLSSRDVIVGSLRARHSQSYLFDEKRKVLQNIIQEKSWDIKAVQSALSELQSSVSDAKDTSHFFRAVSDAVLYCAKHDKLESLQTILNFLEGSPEINEITFNAFRQAMDASHENIVAWLLERNVHQGNVSAIEKQLKEAFEEKKMQPKSFKSNRFNRLAFHVLIQVPLPIDKTLIEIIMTLINEEKPNRISQVQKGKLQLFSDNDGPHLEEIRKAYLFCDYTLKQLKDNSYYKFRHPLDQKLIEKTPTDFDQHEIEALKSQIQHIKFQSEQQKMRMLELKQKTVNWVQEHYEFQNKDRLASHLSQWDKDLDKITSEYDKVLNAELAYAEKILAECEKTKEHKLTTRTTKSRRHP